MTNKEKLKKICQMCKDREPGKLINGEYEVQILIKDLLKEFGRLETFDYVAEQNVELREENQKLKKVIEILKLSVSVEYIEEYEPKPYKLFSDFEARTITKEQYELISEVLENEN